MDPSYIHHSRYVNVSPSNPNFYGSHIYHHNYLPQPPTAPQAPSSTQQLPPPLPPLQQQQKPLPAPPPPPQEQQLRLPAPPPPPPPTKNLYPSYNSQFTFNPNFNLNPKPHNLDHTHHILQRAHDFPRRISVDGDRHHHHQQQQQHNRHQFDSRRDMWDTPRIVPDHRSVADNLEHHRQFDSRPMSPFRSIDKNKHELDTNYRFRERYNNDALEFEHNNGNSNQRVEFLTRRSHFASDPERLNSSNFVILRGSQFDSNELLRNNVRDGVRDRQSLRESNELLRIVDVRDGALDRPSLREGNELLRIDAREVPLERQSFRERDLRDSVIEMSPNSENLGGGTRAFSGKREFYGLDSERYGNNRGSKENSFEYNRTPRKQVQKKSALLRIQKPCHRNRDHDELRYLCHFDGKSGSFRGKDKVLHSDLGMGAEEEREGSPVELDVSFKSNSLVAKTIVTSSSSAVVYDANLMPKNRKTRKVMTADKNCASFEMSKLTDNSRKLESSRDVVNNASNSDSKDLKNSGKKVALFAVGELHGHNSESFASEGNDSIAKITAETSKFIVSDKVGTDGATSKTSLPKVVKKKKIVKKVLKKVVNHNAHVSGLQSTKKLDELVEADCTTLNAPAASMLKKGVKPSKEQITPLGMASDPIVLQPYPNEVTMLCENEKVGGSLQAAIRSKELSTDADSGGSCVAKIKRKMSGSISPSASASHKEIKIDESSVNADNSLHISCNTDTDLVKPLNETTTSDIGTVEGVSKQLSEKGHTLLLENAGTKESSEIIFSFGGNNSDFLSLEENKKHEGHVNRNLFAHEMSTTANFNSLASSRVKISNSATGIVDPFCKQPCKSQGNPTVDSSTAQGFPVVLPGRSSNIFASSSSGETGIQNVSITADCCNHDRRSITDSDNICINSEEINLGTGSNIGEKSPPDGVTISVDNGGREGLQNTICSGGSEKDLPNITDKSKVSSSLTEAIIADMLTGPVKAISSPQCVCTTSLSVKDSSTAKVSVTGSVDVDLQPCPDGVSFLHPSNSTEECTEPEVFVSSGFIGTSPENRKRRKVSACHPGINSQMTSVICERPNTSDLLTYGVGLPSSLNEALIQPEGEVKVSNMDLGSSLAQVSSGVAVRVKDDFSKVDHRRAHSCSALEESDILNASFSFPTGFGSQRIVNATPVMDGTNLRDDVMRMESSKAEKKDTVAAEEQSMMCTEPTQFKSSSEHQYPDVNKTLPDTDVESDGYHFEKNDLPSSVVDGGVCTSNSNDEIMEFDALSDTGSPEIVTAVPVLQSLNCQASTNLSKEASGDEKLPNRKPVVEGISYLFSHATSSQYVKNNLTSDHTLESANLVAGRTVPSPSQNVKVAASYKIPKSGESYGKNQLNLAVSRNQSTRSSFLSTKRNTPFSTHITKPRTWRRTENSSSSSMARNKSLLHGNPLPSQFPEKVAKFQSMSYVRKGNSLVRKPAPVAAFPQVSRGLTSSVYQLNTPEFGELKKITGSDSRADVIDPPNFLRAGGVNAPFERPRTPPLPCVAKVPTCTTNLSGDCTSSPFSEPLSNGCSETTSDPQKILEINDVLNTSCDAMKISETVVNQTGSVNSLEGHVEMNDGTLVTSNAKRITYVKRKSNQLVAASNRSLQSTDKTQGVASDGYYKRRKNQLIRTSLGSQIKRSVNLTDETLILEGKTAPKDIFSGSFGKRSFKVVTKIHQPSRFSLVWTLKSMQSSKDDDSSYRQKVLPSLFPWKRTAYWRRIVQNSVSMSNNSSLSTIGRKLLLMRKRDAVYTRSSHGFSLWKSKVLSVGGSSLKWSKSIEKRSKKVNEEATLAVAAVGRKKVEQNSAASFSSETKNRSHSSRERIFRIGSVRYKMDSSRRTLQRISDDESSCSAALDLEKNPKKSYIPRRLVIGTDEYVRIGNGNQLIRDPKKRTRILASEKVRWSLHTARLRLARKKKYCQFFTRFGKCNKDDGKCPYIHDPSKIAVCTKFLNGLCSNSSCKLTHKVIPERMPDCSYFLQGLCSNKDCPYRHVHVNPKASTCEGFLKGYCADGNECRKKHSYVCPIFEATGSCPLGSKCKLHHPKSRRKGKKIRRSKEQKNTRGRYFGSMNIEDSEPRIMMSQGHSIQDIGDICVEGKFADYISLDASDEEAGEMNDLINAQTTFDDGDGGVLQFDDLDELIKPIRIMNID